jgi:DNA repair exonuclease SbcCD ATPase subunit
MANQDRFRFEPGDEEPELTVPDEELQKRIKRLSQRISFLTLLLPSLIAIVIYVAYHDLTQRLIRTQSSDLQSLQRLTTDVEHKIDPMNARLGNVESTLAKLTDVQNSIQVLREELRKSDTAMEKINAAKVERKEIEEAIQRHETMLAAMGKDLQGLSKDLQTLAPMREELGASTTLRNEIQSLSTRLQKLESGLGKDLTGLAGYMERTKSDLEKLKSDLNGLQARKLDRDAMELEVLKTKRLYQLALDQEIGRIDKALTTLQRRLEQVERAFGSKSGAPPLPPLTGGITEKPIE